MPSDNTNQLSAREKLLLLAAFADELSAKNVHYDQNGELCLIGWATQDKNMRSALDLPNNFEVAYETKNCYFLGVPHKILCGLFGACGAEYANGVGIKEIPETDRYSAAAAGERIRNYLSSLGKENA